MAHVMQDWLQANCAGFIEKNQWPPNYPDLNLLEWTITSGPLSWKIIINSAETQDDE